MGTKNLGVRPIETEPSWTDETLPLDVRHGLLDRALDRIKAGKGLVHGHPANQDRPDRPDHPGESGSESADHNH